MEEGAAATVGRFASRAARLLGLRERRCVACREPFEPEDGADRAESSVDGVLQRFFCPACRAKMKRRMTGFCPYCGEPSLLEDAPCMPCERCLVRTPPWNDVMFFGVYGGLLRELLLRVKFGGSLACADVLGRLLAALCVEHYEVTVKPDVIVPMPLDRGRLRERGFNQCREIVRHVSKDMGVPVRSDLLVKVRQVTPQELLNREQRQNLKQPFHSTGVDGLFVLLVDDVCTTGATLERATESLLSAGASRVDVAVLARSSRFEKDGAGAASCHEAASPAMHNAGKARRAE